MLAERVADGNGELADADLAGIGQGDGNSGRGELVDFDDGQVVRKAAPALTAINMRLRDDYVRDASGGVGRWNKIIEKAGIDFTLTLPHESFHRQIGVFSTSRFDPQGNPISQQDYDARVTQWLPTRADGDFIQSLMKPCYEPGKYAGWIAPPKVGIDNKPGDFEYVKLHMA